jgi:predicted RecB family endonuclease
MAVAEEGRRLRSKRERLSWSWLENSGVEVVAVTPSMWKEDVMVGEVN